jgi:predicted MPP superfamily phosphohydrolase
VPFPQGSAPPNPFHSARNTNLEVRRDRLSIPLGRDLRRPLAIGVVSDIHVHHSRDLPFVEWCIEQVNAFGADMIVALGDLTRRRKKVERTAEVVAHLRAPLGVFLVFGNHELHLGAEIATRAYGDRQVRVLRPEDGDVAVAEGLVLAASEWPFRRHDPLPQRQEGDCRLRVLLAHSPDNLLLAARAGFDLALSGHTHGGFPRVPGLGPLVAPLRCGRGLADGWFRRLDTWMFVTRGIGYVPASPFPRNPQVACVDVWLDPTGSERE